MSALTKQQRDLLGFIKAWQDSQGTSPSFEEMREALALKSKSGVHRLVSALEERGYIRRLQNRARAIEIIDNPHLSPLAAIPDTLLAKEARRRGLVLGHIYKADGVRQFSELRL